MIHNDRTAPWLTVNELSFSFGDKPILDGLSLSCTESPIAVLGPSGCGKTTLLRLIAGLLQPQHGNITLSSMAGTNFDDDEVYKAPVSVVFQEPRLLPWLSTIKNVMLPAKKHLPAAELYEKAYRFLAAAGLAEDAHRYPGGLSGGQQQRASLARAFCYPAPVLLMDEPFQSLDLPLRLSLLETIQTMLDEGGDGGTGRRGRRFLIMVTHDPREAVILARRVIVLGKRGRVFFDEVNTGDRVELELAVIDALKAASKLQPQPPPVLH